MITRLSIFHFAIRLARGKFELTNQDSAGGKKCSFLTSNKQVRKGFEIRQLFSLEMALNIHEKGFTFRFLMSLRIVYILYFVFFFYFYEILFENHNLYEKVISKKIIIIIKNHTSWQKVKKMNHFVFLSFCFGAKKWVAGARHCNSLVVRRVSPGRIIFVLF